MKVSISKPSLSKSIGLLMVILFLNFIPKEVIAQPLYKTNFPLDISLQLQSEFFLAKDQRLLLGIDGRFKQEESSRINNSPVGAWSIRLGYEKWLRGVWAIGAGYQQYRLPNERVNQWRLYGIHNGRIGEPWIFVKRFQVSHNNYQIASRASHIEIEGEGYLGRRFSCLSRQWQLGISYIARKNMGNAFDARRVSQTVLTLKLDFPIGERLVFAAFMSKSTQYYFGLAQERFNADGTLIEHIPYHRLNQITPTIGMSCRILFHSERANKKLPFIFDVAPQ